MPDKYHKLIEEAQKELEANSAIYREKASNPAAKAKTLTKGIAMALLNGATYGNGASVAGALNMPASYYSGSTDLPSSTARKNIKRGIKTFTANTRKQTR
jgi:hypothetical protein